MTSMSRRKLIVSIVYVGIAFLIILLIIHESRERKFPLERWRIHAILETWQHQFDGTNQLYWDEAHARVSIAVSSICMTQDRISITEIRRLRRDIERVGQGKITFMTLDRTWDRLGQTGEFGQQYIADNQHEWDSLMASIRGESDPTGGQGHRIK